MNEAYLEYQFRLFGAEIETLFLLKKYYADRKLLKIADIEIAQKFPQPVIGPYDSYALYDQFYQQFTNQIKNYAGPLAGATIAFGDSILAMWRSQWTAINPDLIFACGGSWSHHMLTMAQNIKPLLDAKGILHPAYLVIGTLGGNPFLMHQEYNATVNQAYICLDGLRAMYPNTKMIVYGIPPIVVSYASAVRLPFNAALYQWVVKDAGESVFLPIEHGFVGKGHVFYNTFSTAEGVHLSPIGRELMNMEMILAKTAKNKSVIGW